MRKNKFLIFLLISFLQLPVYAEEDLELLSTDDMSLFDEFNDDISDDEEVANEISDTEEFSSEDFEIKESELDLIQDFDEEELVAEEDEETTPEDIATVEVEKAQEPKLEQSEALLEEISQVREEKINKIIEQTIKVKDARNTPAQIKALRIQLEDIIKSPLRDGYVRKNIILTDLSTGKKYKVHRGVTVRAHTLTDANNYRYIVDKENNPKYKLYAGNVTNITRTTHISTTPKVFTRIHKVKKLSQYDQDLKYTLKFNLHGGLSANRFTKSIVSTTQEYSPMIRTEVTLMSRFSYPMNFGLSGVYESITGQLRSGGSFSTKVFSLGPVIMSNKIWGEYSLLFQPRVSVVANLTETRNTNSNIYKFSDTSVLFGAEKYTQYEHLGKLTFGFNIQRKWLKPRGNINGFSIPTNISYDDSFALYIGHQSDWLW